MDIDQKLLIEKWNSYFNYKTSYCDMDVYDNSDDLFNDYLYMNNKDFIYEYDDAFCFCEKQESKYIISYVNDNKIYSEEINIKAKRKFFNLINNFEIIITKAFPLNSDTINKNKILLRYEIIRNLWTSNNTHFFSKDLPFSINDNRIFFTKIFKNLLFDNTEKLNILKFGTLMLNSFEIGVMIDDIKLKPKITISPYGRWYWSGTEKVQNDMKSRQKIYDKLLKYGKILNIDLVSGEPVIFYNLSKSSILKKLVKFRIALKETDEDLSNSIKDLINIFIHSVENSDDVVDKFKKKNSDFAIIEEKLKLSLYDVMGALQDEILWYNSKVIDAYTSDLSIKEYNRRIVMHDIFIKENHEILKEHRKYLQGYTHDRILNLAQLNYSNTGLMPIFTIHDSLSYFINHKDANILSEQLIKNAKKLKYPINIEIIETY